MILFIVYFYLQLFSLQVILNSHLQSKEPQIQNPAYGICCKWCVECAVVMVGTADSLSNCSYTVWRVLTERAALWFAFFVRLGPIYLMIFLTSFALCSLCRSIWMLLPRPPLIFTKQFHWMWWASWRERRAFTWSCCVRALKLYFDLPDTVKCGRNNCQQRWTRSPSPSAHTVLHSSMSVLSWYMIIRLRHSTTGINQCELLNNLSCQMEVMHICQL